jgi:hypothetical protein
MERQLTPYLKDYRCIPPQHNGAFVAAMKDIPAVYAQPYDETRPVVCMDEKPSIAWAGGSRYRYNPATPKTSILHTGETGPAACSPNPWPDDGMWKRYQEGQNN